MDDVVRYFGRAVGRVQGVGFRYFVQQNAVEFGLCGWVCNMNDGSVTMELQGSQAMVDKITQKIRKGNAFIRVESLELEPRGVVEDEKRFQIRY